MIKKPKFTVIGFFLLFCSANVHQIHCFLQVSNHEKLYTLPRSTTILNGKDDPNSRQSTKQHLRAQPFSPNNSRRFYLHRPVGILDQCDDTFLRVDSRRHQTQLQISTGLTFDDGDQLLVSTQKPLGMVLEEREEKGCFVVSVVKDGAADRAGVKPGDLLVAVQNADVGYSEFEEVMTRIINAPKVVNLRFWRRER
jgi:hypothetical protein